MLKTLLVATVAAAGCASAAQPPPRFDGKQAYEHVRRLVEIGPRPAGSPGAARARDYIKAQLRALGLTVEEQPFDARTPLGTVRMVNLRATLPGPRGTSGPRLLVGGHYDTKRFEEFIFLGANDGGSSTAFLIELARVLKDAARPLPVELVFFDGEEAVIDWNVGDDNTYGSRHYVAAAGQDGTLAGIRALVLVDMIGDRDLRIMRESNSTPWLTEILWSAARRAGRAEFVDEFLEVQDDHLPFLRAGVPAVDLIDLDYPAWHTEADTLDKVAAESLQAVGDVVVAALPEILERLTREPAGG
jgi:glutaminyl-peptide cyclotransferase